MNEQRAVQQTVEWDEDGERRSALWRSESGAKPPRHVQPADDRTTAAAAYKLACEGTALLWRGDFHQARQMLAALGRRVDRKPAKQGATPAESFHLQRQAQSRRARVLGMLLVPLDETYTVPLRRAPDVRAACEAAYGPPAGADSDAAGSHAAGSHTTGSGTAGSGRQEGGAADGAAMPSLVSLRELLGLTGAYEWQRKGVEIPALGGDRVHPAYGVFSPVRGEYVDLVAETRLPRADTPLAYDVGTGTGVLAAVLARRGVRRVVATDQDPRALACARENAERLGTGGAVEVVRADLFPDPAVGPAPLIVCNPPWVPAKPTSPLEYAVYDPGSRMLRGFLAGLAARLTADGEGWLILSDLAEHLGLRTRDELLGWVAEGGLVVAGREDARPRHPRAADPDDPLHAARAAEVTSLWRLRRAAQRGTD